MLLSPPVGRAIGLIEGCTPLQVRGWAIDFDEPLLAAELLLRVDGRDVCLFRPQLHMPALAKHLKWPDNAIGLVAFKMALPTWVRDGQPHRVEVVFAGTGQALKGGPREVQHRPAHTAFAPPTDQVSPQSKGAAAPKPLVTVVVLNRNGANVLNELLHSWQKFNATVPAEWVVVDHASTDNSLDLLAQWQQRLPITVKALKENRSFSASCNLGARAARTPYLLFLNNDIVWQQDALPVMIETLNQPDVCAVGLKLLKVSQLTNGQQWAEVQHLGVRFTQHQEVYLPYEATPFDGDHELEYAAQNVPAVTGAALLCRRDEFRATGGFHESYFYGFEDVDLCLRLAHHTHKRVVCRNDLLALHRHGYTRLTGREPSVLKRLQHNETVLCREVGLWLKTAWWQSLLTQEGGLCAEPLQVGIYLGEKPSRTRRQRAEVLATHIQCRYPRAKVWRISTGAERYEVRDMHVLVVAAPDHDISMLKNARPDLRVFAWADGTPDAWVNASHWPLYDAYLAAHARTAVQLQRLTPYPVTVPTENDPLPDLQRVRVRIATGRQARLQRRAREWCDFLKTHGIACWLDEATTPQPRLVHVKVWLADHEPIDAPDPACLTLWWRPSKRQALSPLHTWDWVTHRAPDAHEIKKALEEKIGHTFHTPKLSGSV